MRGEGVEVIPLGIVVDRKKKKNEDCKHTGFIDTSVKNNNK